MKHDRSCNATTLAGMLRMIAMQSPQWSDVLEDACDRLMAPAARAEKQRNKKRECAPSAHEMTRVAAESTKSAHSVRTEGGGGVVSFEAPEAFVAPREGKDQGARLSLVQSTETSGAHSVRTQTNSRGWTAGFTRFFDAYPSSERRRDCAVKWVTMGLEDQTTEILAGLELWKLSERWKNGRVLGMREWLENEKWRDAPPPAVTADRAAAPGKRPETTWAPAAERGERRVQI